MSWTSGSSRLASLTQGVELVESMAQQAADLLAEREHALVGDRVARCGPLLGAVTIPAPSKMLRCLETLGDERNELIGDGVRNGDGCGMSDTVPQLDSCTRMR